jgi:hypothetical protein
MMKLHASAVVLLAAVPSSFADNEATATPAKLPPTQAVGKPMNYEITIPQLPGDGIPSKQTIVGGSVASKRYPWLASLQAVDPHQDWKFLHQCGGMKKRKLTHFVEP